MATESDHPVIHEEVKEEIHETKATQSVEETPCVTEETIKEKIPEPADIEQVKKHEDQEAPTTELPVVEAETKETECVKVEEETLKTEVMALDNETKSPADEKKTETVEVTLVESEETKTDDIDTKEKKEDETPSVPTVKEDEGLKIEEREADVKKEVAEEETKEAKENGAVNETIDPEKPALEPVKTESKEEKTVEETKSKESTPKEEEKTTPKQSNSLMGKVKKSFIKAKKAFTGKNTTATATKTPESKEDEKA
ncbi:hypothetical protein E3N88_42838 [Mikania micrantha]|uniref:Uncharacterized protein n=1 Tax=Mikania micrantha TaxID=192012 RepID=A0A5N6LIT7_9ASTR|nr:hypothetical protein E3N88_42838 [Mikania micrantha]